MNLNHFISKKRGHLGFGNYSEKNRMKRIPEDLNTLMKWLYFAIFNKHRLYPFSRVKYVCLVSRCFLLSLCETSGQNDQNTSYMNGIFHGKKPSKKISKKKKKWKCIIPKQMFPFVMNPFSAHRSMQIDYYYYKGGGGCKDDLFILFCSTRNIIWSVSK